MILAFLNCYDILTYLSQLSSYRTSIARTELADSHYLSENANTDKMLPVFNRSIRTVVSVHFWSGFLAKERGFRGFVM